MAYLDQLSLPNIKEKRKWKCDQCTMKVGNYNHGTKKELIKYEKRFAIHGVLKRSADFEVKVQAPVPSSLYKSFNCVPFLITVYSSFISKCEIFVCCYKGTFRKTSSQHYQTACLELCRNWSYCECIKCNTFLTIVGFWVSFLQFCWSSSWNVFRLFIGRVPQAGGNMVCFLCICVLIFIVLWHIFVRNLSSNELSEISKDTFRGLISLEYL